MLVTAAFCVAFLGPMIRFWGAVYGPLRPFAYPQDDVTPAWFVAALMVGVCLLPRVVPRPWFERADGPSAMRWYVALGVRTFRRAATNGDWINRRARLVAPDHRVIVNVRDLDRVLRETTQSERAHMVLLLAGVLSAAYAWMIGWFGWAAALTAGNLVFNVYPVILQRYNRSRLHAVRNAFRPG
jgi:Glycosyl-4,4'-diaponeurosporenoate acyltransferase